VPETLSYQITLKCPISADVRHLLKGAQSNRSELQAMPLRHSWRRAELRDSANLISTPPWSGCLPRGRLLKSSAARARPAGSPNGSFAKRTPDVACKTHTKPPAQPPAERGAKPLQNHHGTYVLPDPLYPPWFGTPPKGGCHHNHAWLSWWGMWAARLTTVVAHAARWQPGRARHHPPTQGTIPSRDIAAQYPAGQRSAGIKPRRTAVCWKTTSCPAA